ncbi:uncharacterized protein HD556DRAFT_1313731 [Suillus plorans]|uniref:Uncharacterized protein n=1 Tax=Suillus plorans TaxID=116603 RepID=A0A9P7ABP4_9AGAM|nr:uncharacterized protein HD556DRAFT_1313731 [Suillus plorans]KAG1786057.1 hypothetical protein HD556DRAFT_1313731 [Suillus plorans]
MGRRKCDSSADERPMVNELRATMDKHSVEAKAPRSDSGQLANCRLGVTYIGVINTQDPLLFGKYKNCTQVKVNKLIGFSRKEGILAMREDTAIPIILSSTCLLCKSSHILRLLASNDDFSNYAIDVGTKAFNYTTSLDKYSEYLQLRSKWHLSHRHNETLSRQGNGKDHGVANGGHLYPRSFRQVNGWFEPLLLHYRMLRHSHMMGDKIEAMSTNLCKDPGIIESEKIEEVHPLVAGLRKTLEIAEHTNVIIGETGNIIKRKKWIRYDAPVSESLVAIDPIMQARIQHRHELEGHDHAAIIKLLSYVQHLVIAKATASSTQSLMAANVVRGTKDQLHTFARKGDDSMEFNDKDAVDLMIPIIQGLEDQNTIDEQILPPTPTVPMATRAYKVACLPTPLESRWAHSRTIVRDSTTIHDVEPPNPVDVDDSASLESFPTNSLSHTLSVTRTPRTEARTYLVGDRGESDGSADGAVAGATAAGALTSSGMEDGPIPAWRWMPTITTTGASKTSESRTETPGP